MIERFFSEFVHTLAVAPLPIIFGLAVLWYHRVSKRFNLSIEEFRKQFDFEKSNSPQKFVDIKIEK